MEFEIYPGFMVYKNGYGPVFVSLHSGHAFGDVLGRDDNSDVIGVLCWKKYGGTLILSTITRDRVFGIDFNRDIPPLDLALEMYAKFDRKKLRDQFKKKYAFVAKNKTDYNKKLRIYNTFWSYVRNSGNFFIFIHRQYARLKNVPSLMDLITFKDIGIKRTVLQKIVEEVNKSYKKFFKKIEKDFKKFLLLEEKRVIELGCKGCIEEDIKTILPFCYKKREKKQTMVLSKEKEFRKILENRELLENISDPENQREILNVFKEITKNLPKPCITLEKIFSAEFAIGPIKQLVKSGDKIAIEIEINEFLSRFYPNTTSEIILDIVKKIKDVDIYKKLGFTQTQILRFIQE